MTNAITLDCNIFGLQRFGGISNYWARLVDAVTSRYPLSCNLILPRTTEYVNTPNLPAIAASRERLPNGVARYLSAPTSRRSTALHSSYYRIPRHCVDRYIVTVYDFTYERYRTGLPKWVHHQQKRKSIEASDIAICISQSTKIDLLERIPLANPSKVVVIPLAVDKSKFFKDSTDELIDLPPFVLFVGQRGGYKRFDLAVDALRTLGDLSLGIVGAPLDNSERTKVQSRLGDRWIEFGPVPDDQLRKLYSHAHSFIFPSDYEGFGLPILEAMACGCPVVAANQSAFPEVAGGAALLSDYQEPENYGHLIEKLGNNHFRNELVSMGHEQVSKFSWISTLEKTIKLYD